MIPSSMIVPRPIRQSISVPCTRFVTVLFGMALLVLCKPVSAQDYDFAFHQEPLNRALASFVRQTGVDVVFSPGAVRRYTTSCAYRGADARAALDCIITGLPLRADRVDENQFVLVPLSGSRPAHTTFRGFVTDAVTGETLVGAHIFLPSSGTGTMSNEVGYFALSGVPQEMTRIRLTYLGYQALDTTLFVQPGLTSFGMTQGLLESGGVTIEETAGSRSDITVTPGLLSVPARRLDGLPGSFGASDVLEVLRWMPGIQRAGEATGGLVIRGSGSDQNLYLIDGVPIHHPWHAFSLISTFQTETFKDINLYRGAFPAEYGGRLSSVLAAELRDGGRTGPRALAAISALSARFLIESPITRKSSFMLSGRRSYIDRILGRSHPVEDDLGRRDTLRTGYFFYDWSAKLSYRPDSRSTLSASYYAGRDQLDLRLPFDLSLDFSSWLRPADLFFEVDQFWGNRLMSVRFQRVVSNKMFLTGTAYETDYEASEGTLIRPTRTASVVSRYNVRLSDLGLRVDLDYYANLRHQLRAGLQVVRHRFESDIDALVSYTPTLSEPLVESGSEQAIETALYVQDLWQPGPRWRLLPGMRLSYFENGDYVKFSPRFSFQYSVDPTWLVLRGGVSSQVQYVQRIKDRHSYLYDLVSARWIPTSRENEPSRSGQVTLGVESRPIPGVVATADAYLRGARNVLLPKDQFQSKDGLLGPGIEVTTLLGQYTRGLERNAGAEFGLDVSRGSWRVIASYTESVARNRALGQGESTYRPTRFDAPRSFSVVTQRNTARWQVSLSILWRSGYPISAPASRYQLTDPISGETTYYFHRPEINNARLPAYFRADVNLSRHFSMAGADWSAALNLFNVLNRRNVVGQSFDPSREHAEPANRLGLPILPLFELQMVL